MTSLVIFYSRTGTTKKIANIVSEKLSCDCEEIFDTKNRLGFFGWLRSGKDAMMKKLTILKEITKNPESYDLIIIGTPIWSSNMSTPIRTYIADNKDKLKDVAFFCTEGSKGGKKESTMAFIDDGSPVSLISGIILNHTMFSGFI